MWSELEHLKGSYLGDMIIGCFCAQCLAIQLRTEVKERGPPKRQRM